MIRQRGLDNKDYLFSRWLVKHGWVKTIMADDHNMFYNARGVKIAVAKYCNTECTYEVSVNQSIKENI